MFVPIVYFTEIMVYGIGYFQHRRVCVAVMSY